MPRPKKTKVKDVKTTAVSGAAGFLGASRNKKVVRSKVPSAKKNWWEESKDKMYAAVDAAIQTIDNAQANRRLNNIKFSRMYGNYEATANLQNYAFSEDGTNRPVLNVLQSVIDAVAAKVAKDRPKVSFITSGSNDYFLKLRAQKLTSYVEGAFKQAKFQQNADLAFRDAEICGTGFVKWFIQDNQVKSEWCFQDEIKVDEIDGLKQEPRSMHQVKLAPRDQVLAWFPEFKEEIEQVQPAYIGRNTMQTVADVILIKESWHLPSTKDAEDGVYAITIDNKTLICEPYKKQYFPITTYRWYPRPLGYFGRSISEEIYSIQIEINKILRTIQQSQELFAVPMFLVENGSDVSEDVLLTNTIARMVPYTGTPPQFVSPQALSQEVYQHLNSCINWAFQIVGLSQDAASGEKPSGVESAVAMREVADIQTGRFSQVSTRWEEFYIENARILVDMSKDLYEDNKDLSVNFSENRILKEIKWKKVDLEDNPYDILTFPTSMLPDTPAGKTATISEYIDKEWISKEKGMQLLSIDPDVDGDVKLQTSSLSLIEKWITEMAEDGIVHQPDPMTNLPLTQSVAQNSYALLVAEGCPEDNLQLIRDFINATITMQQQPPPGQQQMPQAPLAPMAAPAGAPQATPVITPGQNNQGQ